MKSRTKALCSLGCLAMVVIVGVTVVLVGARMTARQLPGHVVLTIDVSGPLPETVPDPFLAELRGLRVLSRQDLRDGLVRAASDRRVRAVRLRIGEVDAGFATLQEIRGLLAEVAAAGKPTAAYLETAGEFGPGNLAFFLASACQMVTLHPMGDLNLTGLAMRPMFIRGMLDKLGIEPEFLAIGEYKTAREFFTEEDFSAANREMGTWLLESLAGQMVSGIASGRGMPESLVAELVRRGPFLAAEALQFGLVDDLADWPVFVEATSRINGRDLREVSLNRYLRAGRPDRRGAAVAVVVADGTIVRGESGFSPVPVFGGDAVGSETLARAWRQVRESGAQAAVFRVNSPGGSAIASEIIRLEAARTAEMIPVVVSMGDMAASGGYWVSCGARHVVASPGTLTASIGVLGGHLATGRFLEERLGISFGRLESSPNAGIYGGLEPWTVEQRAAVGKMLDNTYDVFLTRVSLARGFSREEADALGRGRVFTGEQALANRLVDSVGGFEEALAVARELAGLAPDAPVNLEFYPRRLPFLRALLGGGEEARIQAMLEALARGEVAVPGPVWLPPVEIR